MVPEVSNQVVPEVSNQVDLGVSNQVIPEVASAAPAYNHEAFIPKVPFVPDQQEGGLLRTPPASPILERASAPGRSSCFPK